MSSCCGDFPRVCPKCGADDTLRSVDQYIGTCDHFDGEPQGYTEIFWDTCEEIARECSACDWKHEHTKEEQSA